MIVFLTSLFFDANFQIGITSLIIFISAFSDDKDMSYKRIVKSAVKQKKLARGLKCACIAFDQNTTLGKVCSKVDNFAYYVVLVIDQNYKIIGKIFENQIEKLALELPLDTTLGQIVKQNLQVKYI